MARSLRLEMPKTAEFIDNLRDAFGAEGINAAIRAGLDGQPTFWARENGREVGRRDERTGVTPVGFPKIEPGAAKRDGGRS